MSAARPYSDRHGDVEGICPADQIVLQDRPAAMLGLRDLQKLPRLS